MSSANGARGVIGLSSPPSTFPSSISIPTVSLRSHEIEGFWLSTASCSSSTIQSTPSAAWAGPLDEREECTPSVSALSILSPFQVKATRTSQSRVARRRLHTFVYNWACRRPIARRRLFRCLRMFEAMRRRRGSSAISARSILLRIGCSEISCISSGKNTISNCS